MKNFVLYLFIMGSSISVIAQQIPFQGRLVENGNAVIGQRTFQFSITVGNISWSETHTNESVTNGLYALVLGQNTPLPSDLFANQNSVPLAIQVNGQNLPTTTLYAPFESDPTVPNNLKDGVSWDEVSDKPVLDESPTNEIQQLSISDSQLSISNGNTIELPILSSNLTLDSSLTVGINDILENAIVAQNVSTTQSFQGSVWQSFTINEDAVLSSINLQFGNANGVDLRLKIYEGIGNSGQAIFDATYSASEFSSAVTLQQFTLPQPQNIILTSGMNYTFEVLGIGAGILVAVNESDPYPFGITGIDVNTDLVFNITVQQTSGYLLQVTENGLTTNVDITTTAGRVYDKSGIVLPVGTIVPFGSATVPEGWLYCDGSEVGRDLYADLFAAIGTSWGAGDGASTFHLPDLRGQFLRGVADTTSTDPDKLTRANKYPGGNTGNNVGSYQDDELKTHKHNIYDSNSFGSNQSSFGYGENGGPQDGDIGMTDDSGGSETRPKNASVNFIIKY